MRSLHILSRRVSAAIATAAIAEEDGQPRSAPASPRRRASGDKAMAPAESSAASRRASHADARDRGSGNKPLRRGSRPPELEDEAVVVTSPSHSERQTASASASPSPSPAPDDAASEAEDDGRPGSDLAEDDLALPAGVRLVPLAEGRRRKKPLGPAPIPLGQGTRQLLALRQSLR